MSTQTSIDAPKTAATKPNPARKRAFIALGGVVLLASLGYGAFDLFLSPASEYTDDAYVGGDVVAITAREPGNVLALYADNTGQVQAGQPLIDFDPATADAALAAARAGLGRAVRGVRGNFARVTSAGADIANAQAELSRAQADYERRKAAVAEGAVSNEELAHAADTIKTAVARLNQVRANSVQAKAAVSGTDLRNNPDVLAAIATVRQAAIVRAHMHLIAPVGGVVAQRTVQVGQQVSPGTPLMAVVALDRVWIDANFRETQLADLRVGQAVSVTTDVYGGKVALKGHVLGLSPGSGSAFALLPAQNATGNWIKIVQRVPVRIALDPGELRQHPLQIGLSVKVTADTDHPRGQMIEQAALPVPGTQVSQDGGPATEAAINRIIAANGGGLQ